MWRAANEQSRKLGWLLFVLLLCPTCVQNRNDAPAQGYILDLATVPSPQPLEPLHSRCGDLRYLIATATVNGRARLNGEEMPLDELAIRIRWCLALSRFQAGLRQRGCAGLVGRLHNHGGPHLAGSRSCQPHNTGGRTIGRSATLSRSFVQTVRGAPVYRAPLSRRSLPKPDNGLLV